MALFIYAQLEDGLLLTIIEAEDYYSLFTFSTRRYHTWSCHVTEQHGVGVYGEGHVVISYGIELCCVVLKGVARWREGDGLRNHTPFVAVRVLSFKRLLCE